MLSFKGYSLVVEQRPSKPHVWVRFLLSLYMLFKKPSVFFFKKKLNLYRNSLTKYVRKFQINSSMNVITRDKNFTQKTNLLKNIFAKKWNVKKHFKLKLFGYSKVSSTSKKLVNLTNTKEQSLSFNWKSYKPNFTIKNFNSSLNFLTITPSNDFIKSSCITSNILLFNSLIRNFYEINNVSNINFNSINQLTKRFYLNSNYVDVRKFDFFKINQSNFLNYNTTLPKINLDTNLTKKTSKTIIKSILSRYLPHINLVRLFRRTKNKKTLSYNIDKKSFFQSSIIKINLDDKFYTLNTLKNIRKQTNHRRGFSLLIQTLSGDNLIENNIDSNILYTKTLTKNTSMSPIIYNKTSIQFTLKNYINKPILANLSLSTIIATNFTNLNVILNNSLLYKYIQWFLTPSNDLNFNLSISSLNKHVFSSRINLFRSTNIWPSSFFQFTLKREVLKVFSFNKFLPNVTMWYYNVLIRFMESCTGKKVFLKFNPFIENVLSFSDIARCNMWSIRINSFQRLLGPKIFLNESLRIMHIALRFKDPTFFANWIKGMLNRMSFWKFRLLFRYIKFAMRYLFWLHFPELQFKGLKIKLKGKISVAGNARTRTLIYKIGETGYSKLDNRVLCDASTINTFTGVLGFKIWFFF